MGKWIYPNDWKGEAYDDDIPPYLFGELYDTSKSQDHIDSYLREVRQRLESNQFIVDVGNTLDDDDEKNSRKKNTDFMVLNNLTKKNQQRRFLKAIDSSEFCHVKKTEYGIGLYVFCTERSLRKNSLDNYENTSVYIKFELPHTLNSKLVVISLHFLEKPIYLPFRD